MSCAVYTTEQTAALLGVSSWTLYESVKRGDPPVPPIRVGRRIVWSRAAIDRLLDPGRETGSGISHDPSPLTRNTNQTPALTREVESHAT